VSALRSPLVPPNAFLEHVDDLLIDAPILTPGQVYKRRMQVGREPQRIAHFAPYVHVLPLG